MFHWVLQVGSISVMLLGFTVSVPRALALKLPSRVNMITSVYQTVSQC